MAFSKDTLPSLFRSLKPQPEAPSATAMAAAHITQQKWPIFKSIKTTQVHTPPPLSETERRHWKIPDTPQPEIVEPLVSAGTQAQSLADGLRAMVLPPMEHEAEETPRKPSVVQAPPSHPVARVETVSTSVAVEPPQSVSEANSPPKLDLPPLKVLDSSPNVPKASSATGDDALAQVFKRLRGDKQSQPCVERKPSTFLSRLGKR